MIIKLLLVHLKVVANMAFKPITTRSSYDAVKAFTAAQLVQKLIS